MEFFSSGLLGFFHAMEAETIPQLKEVPETYNMETRKQPDRRKKYLIEITSRRPTQVLNPWDLVTGTPEG